MATSTAPIAEIWVCIDCAATEQFGEVPPDAVEVPWSLIPAAMVTNNMGPEEGEGEREFDTHACQGCGTTLAGHRFRYAVWSWGE